MPTDRIMERVRRVIDEKRRIHPELWEPLTWNGLRAILRREQIKLVTTRMSRPAAAIVNGGVAVIVLNSDYVTRRHTYVATHELGHIWLHGNCDGELCAFVDMDWRHDPREDEAEWFAMCVLQDGPVVHHDLVRKLEQVKSRPIRIRDQPVARPTLPDPAIAPKVVPSAEPPMPKSQPSINRAETNKSPPRSWPSAEDRHLIACRNASRAYPMFQVGELVADWMEPKLCKACAYDDGRKVAHYRMKEFLPHLSCECSRGCRCTWREEGCSA